MDEEKIANLGKLGRDKVTDFEGVITAAAKHLFGCDTYFLTPKCKGGDLKDGRWFDCGRIEIAGEAVKPEDIKDDKPGGEELKPVDDR